MVFVILPCTSWPIGTRRTSSVCLRPSNRQELAIKLSKTRGAILPTFGSVVPLGSAPSVRWIGRKICNLSIPIPVSTRSGWPPGWAVAHHWVSILRRWVFCTNTVRFDCRQFTLPICETLPGIETVHDTVKVLESLGKRWNVTKVETAPSLVSLRREFLHWLMP